MADLNKTIIYYNQKANTAIYIVAFAVGEIVHIVPINEVHTECSDSEKELIREFVKKDNEPESYYEYIDTWINATNRTTGMAKTFLNTVIDKINESSSSESLTYNYYSFNKRNGEYKRIRNASEIDEVKEKITFNVLKVIAQSEDVLTFDQVSQEIDSYLVNNAPKYVVVKCPKCQKYTVFKLTTETTGKCSSCGHIQEIVNPLYKGIDVAKASTKANEANNNESSEREDTVQDNVVFYYYGQPFLPYINSRRELHERIYNQRSSKSIFEKRENGIVFKKDYIAYVEAYDSNFISNAQYELETLQFSKSDDEYFDEDVALYWYYHHYDIIPHVDNRIFVKSESFIDLKDFMKKFVTSNEAKQKFYYSLLNDTYLEFFFNADEEKISKYSKELDFSRLIYQSTGDYVYIDLLNKNIIHNFGKYFFSDLIRDDKDNALRFEFLSLIKDDFSSFGVDISTSLTYFSKLEDHYDYNCFIYALVNNDGYYSYKDLRIPTDERCISLIDEIIQNKYLNIYHNDYNDKLFSQLYTLWKEQLLSFTLTVQIETSLNSTFNGLKDDLSNLLEVYLRRKQGVSPNEVEFVYHDRIDNLLGHAKRAFEENSLVDFTKDREIETITNILFKDKKNTIFNNAVTAFTAMNKEIDKIIKESEN